MPHWQTVYSATRALGTLLNLVAILGGHRVCEREMRIFVEMTDADAEKAIAAL